ncbi:UPF0147 family protein [Candidatus Woesearchaeota archaeon]|nr:UPF0147 family protein [Candidatus Woesearchaeota archaeon]
MISPLVSEIIAHLNELKEDGDTSKNLKAKLSQVIALLNSNSELSVDKSLLLLEEVNSLDLSSYHRTQVWDIISLLESVKR